jgi:hypothetical protein
MNATQRFLRSALLVGVPLVMLLVLPEIGHPATGEERGRAPRADPESEGIVRARGLVETAFVQSDADRLRPALSQRVKIYLSSTLLGVPEGYYGADQTMLLFRRLFAKRTTVRFAFFTTSSKAREDGHAVLPARWVYREERSGGIEARISFTLSPEGPSWRIREIRDLK